MTRTAGTFFSCTSGGSAKPSSSTRPTRKPCSAGSSEAGGSAARSIEPSAARDRVLRRVADGAAERAGGEAEQQELHAVQREQLALRGAEAAHHRAAVEVALDEAARAERDRDAGEDRREQRGEAEEALRAVDRGAHFGPAAFQVVDALAALEALASPRRRTPPPRPASPAA